MLIILSPAKSLNSEPHTVTNEYSIPVYRKEADRIASILRRLSPGELASLMSVSGNLAQLNFERYQAWDAHAGIEKQAILTYDGDVYDGLDAGSLSGEILTRSQNRIRILSGLYGVLKPMDLIRPHRLEMGTRLQVGESKNLYGFWKEKITDEIRRALEARNQILVNLASDEYFKSIDLSRLKARLITPVFKDYKNGGYRIISFYAKRARGLMTRFILQHGIEEAEDLKAFDLEGYLHSPALSSADKIVFVRDH